MEHPMRPCDASTYQPMNQKRFLMRYEYPSLLRLNHSSNARTVLGEIHLKLLKLVESPETKCSASTYRLKNLDERGLLSCLPSRSTVHLNRVHVPDSEVYILHPIALPNRFTALRLSANGAIIWSTMRRMTADKTDLKSIRSRACSG